MDKYGGLDRYILGVKRLGGELGPKLREEMLQKLVATGRVTEHELTTGNYKGGKYYTAVPAAQQPPYPTEERLIDLRPGTHPTISQKIPGLKMPRLKKKIDWKFVRQVRRNHKFTHPKMQPRGSKRMFI